MLDSQRDAAPTSGKRAGKKRANVRQLELVTFRPSLAMTAAYVGPVLIVAGLLVYIPFLRASPEAQAYAETRGLELFGSWAVMVLLIVGAALIAMAIMRAFSSVTRRASRFDTLKLALADATFAAMGATGAAALVAGFVDDMMRVLAVTFVLTFVFTWAMSFPLHRRAWDAAAERSSDD